MKGVFFEREKKVYSQLFFQKRGAFHRRARSEEKR